MKSILIASAFGLLGSAVVMIYVISSWDHPLMALLYAGLGALPLALAGTLLIARDELELTHWASSGQVWGIIFSALISSALLPAAWNAPRARLEVLDRFQSEALSMEALRHDHQDSVRLRACQQLRASDARAITSELTGWLAASPHLALACLDAPTRELAHTRELSRRIALRWHSTLLNTPQLPDEQACLLAPSLKKLSISPQQATTTLYDCSMRAASPHARTCCTRALTTAPARTCEGLSGMLSAGRMNQWGSLGLTLGASWGEPETTKTHQDTITALSLTCPAVRDFALEQTCAAILDDVMSVEDRAYFAWLITTHSSCLAPQELKEWVAASEICALIYEGRERGESLDEILVCTSRKTLAARAITERAEIEAQSAGRHVERDALTEAIIAGTSAANSAGSEDVMNRLMGRSSDCLNDRQLGAMAGTLLAEQEGLNPIDLLDNPALLGDKFHDETINALSKKMDAAKVRAKLKEDDSLDPDDAEEALAMFEEDAQEKRDRERLKQKKQLASLANSDPSMTQDERAFLACLREGRMDCMPRKETPSGFTENRPCIRPFGDTPGGLDEHIKNMEQVRTW